MCLHGSEQSLPILHFPTLLPHTFSYLKLEISDSCHRKMGSGSKSSTLSQVPYPVDRSVSGLFEVLVLFFKILSLQVIQMLFALFFFLGLTRTA